MGARELLKPWLGPAAGWVRRNVYDLRYYRGLKALQAALGARVRPCERIEYGASDPALWERLLAASPGAAHRVVPLSGDRRLDGRDYWERHRSLYARIGNAREKALEHALTFALLDFGQVRRYCDVASSASPVEEAFRRDLPDVEYWKQDLVYATDLGRRVVGGFAQKMEGVPSGFFDAMALHCSFEHFSGASDGELMGELDRVLSDRGACLILPLYVGDRHRIYLDPAVTPLHTARGYDSEAELEALRDYRQEHGRYYSPESLARRVLSRVPEGLRTTLLRFEGQDSVGEGIYLRFGLIVHRPGSRVLAVPG